MVYLVKLEDGTVLWVNDQRVRYLQDERRILYILAEKSIASRREARGR